MGNLKTNTIIVFAVSLILLQAIATSQIGKSPSRRTLKLDEVLDCTTGVSQELLKESIDQIRQADVSPVLKLENGIVIHWSMSGDPRPMHNLSKDEGHLFESLRESGFCRTGALKIIEFPGPQRYLDITSGKVLEGDALPTTSGKVTPLSESNLYISEIDSGWRRLRVESTAALFGQSPVFAGEGSLQGLRSAVSTDNTRPRSM